MKKIKVPAMIPLCLAAMVSRECLAMGLGEAQLYSKLGSPLEAKVPVSGAEGLDAEQLLVKVLPVWDEQSDSAIGGLDPRVITVTSEIDKSGTAMIYLRSSNPIVEPFLNFVLNVRWPMGTINREYTLLLDLPNTMASFQALPAASHSGADTAVVATTGQPAAPARTAAPARRSSTSATSDINAESKRYFTRRGDSLWRIAARLRRARGGDQIQLMDQLYRLNPQAFVRDNRDMLKESVTLNIDAAALASGVPADSAAETGAPSKTKPSQATAFLEAGAQQPGQDAAVVAKAMRREEEAVAAEPAEIEANGGDASGSVDKLSSSLVAVSQEVESVSANIQAMTQRLDALKARLLVLQEQYSATSEKVAGELNDSPVPVADLAELEATTELADVATGGELGESAAVESQAGTVAVELPVGLASNNNIAAPAPLPESAAQPEPAVTGDSEWRGNPWLLLVAGLLAVVGIVANGRRKAKQRRAMASVSRSSGQGGEENSAVVAAQFDDVFDDLDGGRYSAVKKPGLQATAGFDRDDMVPAPRQASVAVPVSAKVAPAAVDKAGSQPAKTAEVDLGDHFDFDTVENVAAPAGDELFADMSFGQTGDDDISHVQTAAAACIELGDFSGAQRILESALTDSESVELRLMLLDVYGQQGNVGEFEALALQIEFAGASDEDIHEIEVLRKAMNKSTLRRDSASEF